MPEEEKGKGTGEELTLIDLQTLLAQVSETTPLSEDTQRAYEILIRHWRKTISNEDFDRMNKKERQASFVIWLQKFIEEKTRPSHQIPVRIPKTPRKRE